MRKTIAIALLVLLCHVPQAQMLQGIVQGKTAPAAAGPALINPTSFTIGAIDTYTTAPIDTTGAKLIAFALSSYYTAGEVQITDNKGNGTATSLTQYGSGGVVEQISYFALPTVGTGHTFTFTGATNIYGTTYIIPISGINGAFDAGTDSGSFPGLSATCLPGSITPPAGKHMVITSIGDDIPAPEPFAINGGYTITGTIPSGAALEGITVASLVQSPNGSVTNPTWTGSIATANVVCAIASFN